MWVLLDNRDSFSHILHHALLQAADGGDCLVLPSDGVPLNDLISLAPRRLILGPGPERPEGAGVTMAALAHFCTRIPVLGVCLGHQALGLQFGARLVRAPEPVHGHTDGLRHGDHPLFAGLPQPLTVMRYHSLVLEDLEQTELQVLATAKSDGTVQAVAHRRLPCVGVQFHPESVGTPGGVQLLRNWATMAF